LHTQFPDINVEDEVAMLGKAFIGLLGIKEMVMHLIYLGKMKDPKYDKGILGERE